MNAFARPAGEDGAALTDDRCQAPCPHCGHPAEHGHIERAEGSLNVYRTLACDRCGVHEGFDWLAP